MNFMRMFAAAIVLAVVGCSNGTPLAPVTGTVTLDGKPLTFGTILFETSGARPAQAIIKDGRIVSAGTYADNDGVPLGKHTVAIQAVEEAAAPPPSASPGETGGGSLASMSSKSLVPEKYTNPATSGLTAEVKRGGNELKFELKSE